MLVFYSYIPDTFDVVCYTNVVQGEIMSWLID